MTTRLKPDRYLELLQADGERLSAVARSSDLDAAVPTCPGWTVRDAVAHTAEVYQHKIACMRLQRRPEQSEWAHEAPGGDVVGWFDAGLKTLLDELRTRGPEAPAYTWWPPEQTVGFWYRRMAQETAVHRFDVESGTRELTPVADDLAVDGVDEVLVLMLSSEDWTDLEPDDWAGVSPEAGAGRSIAVRTGDSAWRVTLRPDRVDVLPDSVDGDALVTGEPSEVLLWLWGRRPDEAVRFGGDQGAIRALRDRISVATQ